LPPPIPGFSTDRIPDPRQFGIEARKFDIPTGGEEAAKRRLERFLETAAGRYHEDRDRPDRDGTSRLSPYLRFGVISVRQCFERAEEAAHVDPALQRGVAKWLDELVWREFYSAILEEHPRVLRESYRREYDALVWNDDPEGFEAWCEGRTGYPIVDAGMRQLRATGWMHNRVRMIVASFLTKDLLIDWREGERFFFERLVDGDPASNNGGWQWAASTGTDAQPYFRIFNPVAQGRRWDPEGRYVRHWIPELRDVPDPHVHAPWESELPGDYPPPIVDHAERRELALERFSDARKNVARP
jgi:deoxyribodipyrimidine photo-lyase